MLLLAGASTHLGLLDLRAVVAVAAIGAFLGDNLFFLIGRRFGPHVADRLPWVAAAVPRVDRLIARWRWVAVIALRFMYGLRMAGPVPSGREPCRPGSSWRPMRWAPSLWAALIGGLGYSAGHAVEQMLGSVVGVEKAVLVTGSRRWSARHSRSAP